MADLKHLDLNDRALLSGLLKAKNPSLAAYAFESVYVWQGLFGIYLADISGAVCVFFEDASGLFMYLPPLGRERDPAVIQEVYRIMDERNSVNSPQASRIENLTEDDRAFYEELGYECLPKSCDYICRRDSIANYKGDKFKHKRSAYNHFVKNNVFEYLPFWPKDGAECLALYDLWASQRKAKISDRIYSSFLDDNRSALSVLLMSYPDLAMTGRIIRVNGKIKAFTFGYELKTDTFAVLYEVTDLEVKGISQYIFSTFAGELPYTYLNIMDDSGLENLKEAKLSFHPERTIQSYIAVKG
jgi:hypothetical protein